MPEGLQVFNTAGNIQIDSTFKNQKLVWSGSWPAARYGNIVPLYGVDARNECPAVFIRTSGWFGGFEIRTSDPSYPSGCLVYYSTTPVDVAVFAYNAPNSTDNTGIQVFNAAGEMVFHSSNIYCRIQDIAILNGSTVTTSANFAQQPAQPFIMANAVTMSLTAPFASGSDLSFPPWIMAVVYNSNSITCTMPESWDIQSTGRPQDSSLNPYNGRTMQIPIGFIPGL